MVAKIDVRGRRKIDLLTLNVKLTLRADPLSLNR